jgi:predicted nicotinamide N-methyase
MDKEHRHHVEHTLQKMIQQIQVEDLNNNPKQWVIYFQYCVSILGNQKGEFNVTSGEEAKTLAIDALSRIFSPTVGKIFAGEDKRIILGHFIAVILSICVNSKNRANILNSITLLENVCLYVHDANTLSCFLPGITGGVHKLICDKHNLKRGNNVLRSAISLWKTIINLTISNDVNQYIDVENFRKCNKNKTKEDLQSLLQSYGVKVKRNAKIHGRNVNTDEMDNTLSPARSLDSTNKIQVHRNKKWLYETTAKISIVASTILKTINSLNDVQSQNRYKVHLEIIELANIILINCSNTMTATCQDDFLEIVLQFSISSISDQVIENANITINKIKEMYAKNTSSGLWKRIENRFECVLKLMSKNLNIDLEEDTLMKRIQTLVAYIDLLQNKIGENIFTMMNFKKQLFYISKILKPDYQNINTRVRQPLKYDHNSMIVPIIQPHLNHKNNATFDAIGYYDIPFKYMKNNTTKQMAHILLSKIGTYVDGRMLLEYLTEFTMLGTENASTIRSNVSNNGLANNLDWRHASPCECIFMSNSIIYGAKDQLTNNFVENCLKNTVNSKLWRFMEYNYYQNIDDPRRRKQNKMVPINLLTTSANLKKPRQTMLQHSEHVIISSLFFQRLASIAEIYSDVFKINLLDIVYPLLEKLSDDDPIIQQNALYCIKRVCLACDYTSVNHLIEANVDYVIDSICSRLNFLNIYPTTPRVIRSVVKHTVGGLDATYGGLLKEIVQTLLSALDAEVVQQNTFSFITESNILGVLLHAVEDLMACLSEYIEERKEHVLEKEINKDLKAKIIKLSTPMEGLLKEIIAWETILSNLDEDGDTDENNDGVQGKASEIEEQNADSEEASDTKPFKMEREVSQKIITKLCIFLPESPCILQCKIIKSIVYGLQVLQYNEKQLLPTVAEVWKHLISRFHTVSNHMKSYSKKIKSNHFMDDANESEYFPVIRESLHGVVHISKLCPDFIFARFSNELWPKLIYILKTKVTSLFTSKNSVTLDELYINENASDNLIAGNDKKMSIRKAKFVARSTTHKYIHTIVHNLLKLSECAPLLLYTHIWELTSICCKTLRIIPENFMDGNDHKMICKLLLNLYNVDSASVFHAIIMEENLDFKYTMKKSGDNVFDNIKTYLPELVMQSMGRKIVPIYQNHSKENGPTPTLLEKLNIHPKYVIRQVKHELFLYDTLRSIPSKFIYPSTLNPLESYIFHSGINMSGKKVGSLGIKYAVANKPFFPYLLNEKDKIFNITQKLNVGLGAVVWDCGLVLAKIIENYLSHDKFLSGKSVIDLGCGTGFCGILAKMCGASKVLLTDVEEIICVAKENVQLAVKSDLIDTDENITCKTFDWAVNANDEKKSTEINSYKLERYDVIFASDCLYDTNYYSDLIKSFGELVTENGVIIIVYKLRHADREYGFFKALQNNGFYLCILTEDCIDVSLKHLKNTGLFVVIARKQLV